jgi:hypothetical protein
MLCSIILVFLGTWLDLMNNALIIYSLLSASIGSMFDAFHAGYNPDRIQTTIPITIPSGT